MSLWPRTPTEALEQAEVFLLSAKAGLTDYLREPTKEWRLESAAWLVNFAAALAAQAIFLARGGKRIPDKINLDKAAKLARTKAERKVVNLAQFSGWLLHSERLLGEDDHGAWIVRQQIQRTARAFDALVRRKARPPARRLSSPGALRRS